ncbi:MAG: threonine--tRNA ligase [Myxococcota bacterium]
MLDHNDHRSIGNRLDLFHLQEEAPGAVFWHPRGWALFRSVEDHIRANVLRAGYQEVRSPQLLSQPIWEASGHWGSFQKDMFILHDDDENLAIKPVSCPGAIQIYAHALRSYRDLPMRLAEFGHCHRHEARGALMGLMRLRAFVQDDGHIFCEPQHVEQEVRSFCALLGVVYRSFGLPEPQVFFSSRPEVRGGSEEDWDRAEALLHDAAAQAGLSPEEQAGQGAFYGPKLEWHLKDARGRSWQCGTLQLDLVMPKRFGISYVDAKGQRAAPVMLHRALLGSLERFVAILLEHHRGRLPLWLSPEQVALLPVGGAGHAHARRIHASLVGSGVRCHLDAREESLSRRIRDAHQRGASQIWIAGEREAQCGGVSVREHREQRVLPVDEALHALQPRLRPPEEQPVVLPPVPRC